MPRPKRGGKPPRGGVGRRSFEPSFAPFAGTSTPLKAHHVLSMSEEARNTERHHNWDSDMKLRHTKINFVSGGSERPTELVEEETRMAEMTLDETVDGSGEITLNDLVDESAKVPLDDPVDESTKTSSAGIPTPQAEEPDESFEMSFVVDTVGSQPVNTGFAAPQLRPSSPTPSDSSGEVILFAGREQSRNGQMRAKPPRRTRVEIFDDKIKLVEDKLHHAQEELLEITSHKKPTPTHPSPSHSRKGKKLARNPRNSFQSARDARKAEEEAMIADYIANMEIEVVESDAEKAPVMSQRDLGGSDDDIWLDEENASTGEAVAETQYKISNSGWDRSELHDLDDLSTSDEMMGVVKAVLSKRERINGIQYLVVWNDESVDDARWVPDATLIEAPGAAELIKAFEVEEKLVTEFMDAEEESDDSEDSDEVDSDDDLDDDQDDEEDLVQRKMNRMTDEQIARLLAKQEELGMGSEELMLFDDDDDEREEENSIIRSVPKYTRQNCEGSKRPRGDFPAALELADAYDGFDVMDFERPSLKRKSKGRKGKIAFDLSDSEFESSMQMAWENDREKKKERKQEREELRATGLLGKKKGKPDLKAKYKEGMQISEVEAEIKAFLRSDNTTLALPPMDKAVRKVVHEIANAFNLKSKSAGSGKKRFPILYRTSRTSNYSERSFEAVTSKLNRRFLPRMDAGRGSGSGTPRRSARGGAGDAGVSYRDGDVVGGSAPELGAENRGRAMLEKMGWSSGTALGALNNKGIMQPVTHIVKTTKAGLG